MFAGSHCHTKMMLEGRKPALCEACHDLLVVTALSRLTELNRYRHRQSEYNNLRLLRFRLALRGISSVCVAND